MQRLARLSTPELRERLRDEDEEVRRAAVLACARVGSADAARAER